MNILTRKSLTHSENIFEQEGEPPMMNYENLSVRHFKDNGKIKLLIIVGTRPEVIRLAAVIKKCRMYFDTLLAHTGQNYDYNLNGIFLKIWNWLIRISI